MNILDHRILIPTSQETVWEYISDLASNPTWQADCKNIAFVSTHHSGVGVRWRCDTGGGRSYIIETTTWYDKLGYEYTFVDGAPFRESKGRIRLQEIAEGTIVQWTFTYETGGFLGGVRNALATKRQIESTMIESLRSLWSAIQKSGKTGKPLEAKSLMQDALDYEARAHYKPRHAPNKPDTPEQVPSEPIIVEPPISEDDTRPRAPVKLDTSVNEPAFLSSLPNAQAEKPGVPPAEAASHLSPETPPSAQRPVPVVESPSPSPVEVSSVSAPPPPADNSASTEEDKALTPEKPEMARDVVETPSAHKADTQETVSFTTTTTTNANDIPPSTEELAEIDTAEMSVFDVFGLPRPSQTQEMQAVSLGVQPQTATLPMSVESAYVPLRVGLRFRLRRKLIRLRRVT
jgi:Polyketide cyclase / dehydrase and lipid transport